MLFKEVSLDALILQALINLPCEDFVVTLRLLLSIPCPSDTIWQHRSGSALAPAMACCLMAPSPYLHQCCLIIKGLLYHSPESNYKRSALNSLRPRQNGRLFADDTFKCIFLNETIRISTKNSLKFVPKGLINNIAALVLIMTWRRPGDKPLSEPMMVSLPTHICVARPQWVKFSLQHAVRYYTFEITTTFPRGQWVKIIWSAKLISVPIAKKVCQCNLLYCFAYQLKIRLINKCIIKLGCWYE